MIPVAGQGAFVLDSGFPGCIIIFKAYLREGGFRMRTARLLLATVLLLSAILAAGCAAPFSKGLLKQADRSVTVDKVLANPDAFGNALVLWGGVILDTKPKENFTTIEISERPLDYQKRPRDMSLSRGRFMARYKGFLDPSVFCKGKDITLIGRVTGSETGRIGEYSYTYPVVSVEEYNLWAPYSAYTYAPYPDFYYPYSPFYDPWWYYY
jgi:outer membrane lipoprotein